jgi:proteasome lid subunit RPN8/RPN11
MIEYLNLPDTTIQHMISHAEREYPNECCGIVVDGQYIPFHNDAEIPEESFAINNIQFYKYYEQGKIQYLVHSHNNKDNASALDQMKADDLELSSIIINVRDGRFAELFYLRVPTPLVGRPFRFGVWDCLQLVYDFYKEKYKVKLPNPPRDITFLDNNHKFFEEYLEELTQLEIVEIDDLQEDDILFYMASGRIIHVGIYLSEDKCLHHWFNRKSDYFPLDYKKQNLKFAMRLKNGN